WRARPPRLPDPYQVWLSEIMLQQTTVAAVGPYFRDFIARWPTVRDLASAPLDDVLSAWAGLGYYARARNLHRCACAVVEQHGGVFPDNEEALRTLPGIGAYTAAAIAAIAFGRRAVVVDGNVERVMARLFSIGESLPAAKPRLREAAGSLTPSDRAGDYAQAVMDLGATICTPRAPRCVICPWSDRCAARRRGDPEAFPVKPPKKARPRRQAIALLLLRDDGAVWLRRRPAEGLLGGMLEVPSTTWSEHAPDPELARTVLPGQVWQETAGAVVHVFTHFELHVRVWIAQARDGEDLHNHGMWIAAEKLGKSAIPSVMWKIIEHGFKAAHRQVPQMGSSVPENSKYSE
ncbi:MAG TPA: A/G-specific adenine glycosylase, partial [Alphaproteobacteria bacterium]|nr:A/G-specific adenine glycosylase [Alphaproteobacteria bacterium]